MSADDLNRPVSQATTNDVFATPRETPMRMLSDEQLRTDIHTPLEPPSAPYLQPGPSLDNTPRASYVDDASQPRDSAYTTADVTSPHASTPFLNEKEKPTTASSSAVDTSLEAAGAGAAGAGAVYEAEKAAGTTGAAAGTRSGKRPIYKRPLFWLITVAAIIIIVLAVILPVYFTVIKPHNDSTSGGSSASGGGSGSNPSSPTGATTGGNGTEVIDSATGEKFTYTNAFGGFWVDDPADPFSNNAQANSWTPPLNSTWTWGTDLVYGVNLGGLFVIEPFITPSFFQKYPGAEDEWTLSEFMANDTSDGGGLQNQLEDHYNTFITEVDIAQIAGAGLNWIRLPIPYWAIETWEGEPFLEGVCWKYILRMIGWARKYGLRIYLDLHTVPGSQNGYNHSGKFGQVNFMNGIMGIANAQRTLEYIRVITEFISQDEYKDVVPVFGIVNEALVATIGREEITTFYYNAHQMIRNITGVGEGNGPYIAIHDGFLGVNTWGDFLPGSDRIIMDTHPYFAFDGQPNDSPLVADDGLGEPGGIWPLQACNSWGASINTSQVQFGVTVAGEWSNGYNDCGLYVEGVNSTTHFGGDCNEMNDWQSWNDTFKAGLKNYALASMDATHNFWFWTWKIGNSSTSGTVEAPLWSYQLGLENGWMPTDPREALGKCDALGASMNIFPGTYSAWQTGGSGAGTIDAAQASSYSAFPPTSLNGLNGLAISLLPTYTATGSVVSLSPTSLTDSPSTVTQESGWFDAGDTAGAPTPIAGCSYGNAWDSIGYVTPTAVCGAGATATVKREVREPIITPAPPPPPTLPRAMRRY